jgi:hypothetical protein
MPRDFGAKRGSLIEETVPRKELHTLGGIPAPCFQLFRDTIVL